MVVLGPVDPESLGVVLPHEHLLVDMRYFLMPPEYGPNDMRDKKISMETLGKIRQYP